MMNEKAKEMGFTNSHFVVPHGLDNDGHYTTAYELAKMADYALKIDKFKEIVSTQNTTIYINGYAKAINNSFKHIENALKYQSLLEFSDDNDRTIKSNKENN